MKLEFVIFALNIYFVHSFLFKSDSKSTNWDDLKVTWGINPFDSNSFVPLPRTETEAILQGWVKEKDCSQVNGIRYILNGDRGVLLIFDVRGIIAGIGTTVPKGLPFNFPSAKIQKLFHDEGEFFTLTAYFVEPSSVCSPQKAIKQVTGDRLVIKGDSMQLDIALEEKDVSNFWTLGQCFYTMGIHYWANIDGIKVNQDIESNEFVPFFLLYNKGKLNGFGWAFNANLPSIRYEHPPASVINRFFREVPKFFSDPTKSGILSTMHIFLDKTPQLNFC